MTLSKWLIGLCLSGAVLFACRKKGPGPDNPNNQRIESISDGSELQLYEYDSEGRIARLYYNASYSLKFNYSPVGVNIQVMGSGDMPDPDRKYDFTIVNGRITTGKEYRPNKMTRNFSYGYDDQGRLTEMFIAEQYDGATGITHYYKMSYNMQNNVQEINFVKKDNSGNDYADSIFISKTYYDKKFISWGNIGFDYFGVAPVGQSHLGYGITVPLQLASNIYPANNALKSETTDRYFWNSNTKKWVFDRTSSFTVHDSIYQYDAGGRLLKYYGREIKWK